MSGYIEDKISIYVDVRELAKPHKNLIVDKIVENLSDFDGIIIYDSSKRFCEDLRNLSIAILLFFGQMGEYPTG